LLWIGFAESFVGVVHTMREFSIVVGLGSSLLKEDHMREKPEFRDELESILRFTEGRHLLSCTDVCNYLGRSYRFVKAHLGISKDGITATQLARRLTS